MKPNHLQNFKPALLLVVLGAMLATVPFTSLAGDEPRGSGDRLTRQIGVMEGILDQVLLDSKNFLVRGKDNARGLYLDEYGAIFTFDASLTDNLWGLESSFKMLQDMPFEVRTEKDGESKIIIARKTDPSKDSSKEGEDEDSRKSKAKDSDRADALKELAKAKKEKADPAALYKKGKEEITQTLLDYGDTLSALRPGQWVVIAAFLRDSEYFRENRISRLVLKAKVQDLRDFSAGKITESDMRARIVEEQS